MEVVLFHIRTRTDLDVDEYERTFEEMCGQVALSPGFVSIQAFSGADGSELAVAFFESKGAIEQWRVHDDHLRTQQRGRSEFFMSYQISIGTIWKQYHWSEAEGRVIDVPWPGSA